MERDAASALSFSPNPVALAEVVPPYDWGFVRKVGLLGAGLIAVAAVLGLAATLIGNSTPWPIHTARLFLVFIGALAAAAAVSMRPELWQAWAIGTAAALLAIFGTPAHWDSFRLLFGVMGAVALTWTVLLVAPIRYRLLTISILLVFHFTGIFFAATTPPSTPWVTEQAFMRVYNPYLQFLYLRNAYHFYSPQPGPASILVFLLKTETVDPVTGEKRYKTQWVVLPKRPNDVKDPMGLTYYRRLSLTEQVARATPAVRSLTAEAREMRARRQLVPIPLHPTDELDIQYQLLQPEVARYIVPSYASHVILENTPDKETAAKTTVKIYRLQHNTMAIDDFINWRKIPESNTNPYDPTTYRPFFLGEFDAFGNLVDPQEPMLYWLVPITTRPGGVPPGNTTKRHYLDYMSFHALGPQVLGEQTTVDQLGESRFKGITFDWSQLR